jgi:hypothetical protein
VQAVTIATIEFYEEELKKEYFRSSFLTRREQPEHEKFVPLFWYSFNIA